MMCQNFRGKNMKCREKDCPLSFNDENTYYFHLIADHNLMICPICPSTSLRPRNLQQHLFRKHKIDWNNQKFVDLFIEKFGQEDSLFDFLEIVSGFIPLDIMRNITRKMVELSGGIDRLNRQISISIVDFAGEYKVYETPTLDASEYTKISGIEVFYYQLQYATGDIEEVKHFWYQFALSQISEFRQLDFETFINLILFGLNLSRTSKLYYNAVDELYSIVKRINHIKNVKMRVRILNLAINHFSQLGRKEHALESFQIFKDLVNNEVIINKKKLTNQIAIIDSLLQENTSEIILLLKEHSKKYHYEFPILIARDQITIGNLLVQNEKFKEARKEFELAFKIFEQQKNFNQFVKTGINLVKVHLKLQQYSEAIKCAKYTSNTTKELRISSILKLSLEFGILNIDYFLIKDLQPKTLDDIKAVFRKIKNVSEVIDKIEDALVSGEMDHYSPEDLNKIEAQIDTFKKSFSDLHGRFTQNENKIITNELIQLGLSTFSSIDKNFTVPDATLRERLYNILTSAEKVIGYRFNHPHLLWQSLLDIESKKGTKKGIPSQKLAFLGDAALKLAISEILMEHGGIDSSLDELSKRRQKIEKNANLSLIFDRLELDKYILSNRDVLPSDTFSTNLAEENIIKWKGTMVESIIGAIYFDGGVKAVKRFLVGWKPQLFVNLSNDKKEK